MAGITERGTTPTTRPDDSCRLCNSSGLELVLKLTPIPMVDAYVPAERLRDAQESYPLDVYLCSTCGHAQVRDVIDPEAIYRDYIYVTTSSQGLVEHFRQYAEWLLGRWDIPEGSLAVDIGSNDGTLLRFLKERGMSVLGVDPADQIALEATRSGVETLPTFFTPQVARTIRQEHGPATLITANNVLANVDNVPGMIEGIRELLAPDGIFVFETFYLADLIRNMVFDFIYHEHLNCFSVKPLQAFFHRHGMELIHVERIAAKGGSIRGTVQSSEGRRPVSESVASMIASESELGLHEALIFHLFARRIENVRVGLVDVLDRFKAERDTICGYGASATTTPLIYHFGLHGAFDFLVDDNPRKQGLFSPGLHIPVLSSRALYERKPACTVILAWRYATPIMERHQAYLDQGGHFVVPLPEILVV